MDNTTSNNLITMGTIIGAFGIKGWVKIKSSVPASICSYESFKLINNGIVTDTKIEQYFLKDGIINAKLTGINDRDVAFALRGAELAVERSSFPQIDTDNEYYWVDLIGLNVYNQEQINLGVVTSLMETGANDVLVVQFEGTERLIPFIKQYVINVDLSKKQIIVDWGIDY